MTRENDAHPRRILGLIQVRLLHEAGDAAHEYVREFRLLVVNQKAAH
jgi:hypothetical protein